MEQHIKEGIEKSLKDRKRMVGKKDVNEADFLCGAMQMYLLLNPDAEEEGNWCPPSWVLPIMRGESVVD